MKETITMLALALALIPTGSAASSESSPIFIGNNEILSIGEPVLIEWSYTGLTATPEARKYFGAVRRLVTEGLETVPAETKVASSRMTGHMTWVQVTEVTMVAERVGNTIDVRSPRETEREIAEESVINPFGSLAAIFFTLMLVGNVAVSRVSDTAFFPYGVAYSAFCFAVAAAVAIAVVSAIDFGTIAAAAFAVATAFSFQSDHRVEAYRRRSSMAAAMMALAVWFAL